MGDMEQGDYDETLDGLEFMDNQSNDINDMEYSQEYNDDDIEKKQIPQKPQKQVTEVTKEYLHLTASVVSMKFPKINHIPSDELINKVKNYQFFEYHDMMVRIMKTEQQKMIAKAKLEKEAKIANSNKGQKPPTGALGAFRNFFGGFGRQRGTSQPAKSPTNNQQIKNRIIHKTANLKEDAKKTAKEIGKNSKEIGKKVKDNTIKKLTGKPSDDEIQKNSDLSFATVPGFDTVNKPQKVKKPDEKL